MNENRILFHNTFFLTVSAFAVKLTAYIYFVIIVKFFTPDEIGIYAVLITSYLFMELISNLGLDKILIRDLASADNPEKQYKLFYSSLVIRLVAAAVVYAAALFLFSAIYPGIFNHYPLALSVFFGAVIPLVVCRNIESYFMSKEKMWIPALSQLVERIGVLLAALLVAAGILSFSGFITAFFGAVLLRALLLIPLFPWNLATFFAYLNSKKDFRMIQAAYQLLMVEIMVIIYFRVDIFMLSKMTDLTSTGIYQVSYKIFDFFIAIFAGFITAIYPRLVRSTDRINLCKILFCGFIALAAVSTAVIIMGDRILGLLGDSYLPAADALSCLMLTLPFVFITSMLANYAVANRKTTVLIKLALILVALNIALNYILIPIYSINGAAVSTLACETVSALILVYVFRKAFQSKPAEIPAHGEQI